MTGPWRWQPITAVAVVLRALKSAGNTHTPADYWNIKLPRETRRYVPRILALAEIISHPARFNMSLPHLNSAVNHTMVSTGGQIEMARVAELAGVELGVLRATNPAQLRWATAPDVATTPGYPASRWTNSAVGLLKSPHLSASAGLTTRWHRATPSVPLQNVSTRKWHSSAQLTH